MPKRDLFANNIPESSVFARRVVGDTFQQSVASVRTLWESRRASYLEVSPWYQRGEVWTLQQKRDLIDTLFSGLTIPAFYVRDMPISHGYHYQMVDGKQRFLTIMGFMDGEFSYVAADGREWLYADLTPLDKDIFATCSLSFVVLRHSTDEEIVKIYNRLNFSGTPHAEDQRADLAKNPDPPTVWGQENPLPGTPGPVERKHRRDAKEHA